MMIAKRPGLTAPSRKSLGRKCRIAAVAALLALAGTAPALSGERDIVSPDRQGRATPWVTQYAEANSVVVPYSSIPMLAGVPRRTEFYEIDSEVVESGYFYYYYVRGKRHDYVVESTVKLFRLIYELAVLEQLADHEATDDFITGIGQGVKGIGLGLGSLITSRGKNLQNVGANIGRMFKNHPEAGVNEKGEDRSLLGDGPAGGERRRLAYELGLDVYTDNPDIRQVLVDMARARTLGAVTAWAATGSMMSVFSANAVNDDAVEQFIRDLDPGSVREEVGKKLGHVFGMRWEDADTALGRFIRNPNYTPRHIAYAGKCLGDMAQVRDLGMILDILAQVDNPETADLAYLDLRMHHIMHTKVQPLAAFVELEYVVAAQGTNGEFYFLFPGDVLSAWSVSPAEIDEVIREAMGHKSTALKVLALGAVHPDFADMLKKRGIQVFHNIMRDARFFSEDF